MAAVQKDAQKKITILIADDHVVFRQGTRNILEMEPDLEVVAEAADGEQAVALAMELNPDIAIVDIAMPGMDGIAATKKIRSLCPNTNVLILSAYDDDPFVFGLMRAGAAGYLLKTVNSRELINAIRTISEGDSVLHPTIARKVLGQFMPSTDKPAGRVGFGSLSQREVDILKMMSRSLSNKEMAEELGVSSRTIQTHLRRMFKKLGVNTRMEAVMLALKENWITLDHETRLETSNKPEV